MVGSAIVRRLRKNNHENLVFAERKDLDLREQDSVREFLSATKPDLVIIAAAKVGGILANRDAPGDFILENLLIQTNLIAESFRAGIERLLFLGSSCIYPKFAKQPISEDELLTGMLEPTNESYAVAKIAGLKLCAALSQQYGVDYRSVMPTNLYGPGDNFDAEKSHVIPGLIRRFHDAVQQGDDNVVVWGSGNPRREFLYVDDMADASFHVLQTEKDSFDSAAGINRFVNVGSGVDHSIRELADLIAKTTGFDGKITWDTSKPDGTPRKLLDVSRLESLEWSHSTGLEEGLSRTYSWYTQEMPTSVQANSN
ncbi:MAG: GDP-L-fucose synthase [Rhodothermales bacterium]|nr:GDP-L-fucose synthase [Rhodothermales bacterium]